MTFNKSRSIFKVLTLKCSFACPLRHLSLRSYERGKTLTSLTEKIQTYNVNNKKGDIMGNVNEIKTVVSKMIYHSKLNSGEVFS